MMPLRLSRIPFASSLVHPHKAYLIVAMVYIDVQTYDAACITHPKLRSSVKAVDRPHAIGSGVVTVAVLSR